MYGPRFLSKSISRSQRRAGLNAKDKIMFEDMKRYFLLSSPDVGGGDGGGVRGRDKRSMTDLETT